MDMDQSRQISQMQHIGVGANGAMRNALSGPGEHPLNNQGFQNRLLAIAVVLNIPAFPTVPKRVTGVLRKLRG